MTKINTEWALFAIIVMTSMLITATTLAGPVLAVKKSGSSVKTIYKTSKKTTTTAAHNHIRGVKLLSAHTIPSKITVGNRFSIGVTVFNNSSATITFANGTCTSSPSPLSITFNRNAMIESQASAAATPCKAQQVTLKPGEHSQIKSPNLSSIIYAAAAPGITNATMIFKYGVETATSKSSISDATSRTYGFDIQQSAGPLSTTTTSTTTTPELSPLKIPVPFN
jgi:hypothetical protein